MADQTVLVSLQADLAEARVAHRAHIAALLRLIRQSRRDRRTPQAVFITDDADRFHIALWALGAFKRHAIPGAVWINRATGWPVVRHPATLQYLTLDTREPLGTPRPFPYPRYSHLTVDNTVLTVQ